MRYAERLIGIKDVVARTGLSRSKVYEEIASGRLRSVKVGARRLVLESAFIDYLDGLAASGERAEVPHHV